MTILFPTLNEIHHSGFVKSSLSYERSHSLELHGDLNSILFSTGEHQVLLDYTDFNDGIPDQFLLEIDDVCLLSILLVYKNTSVQVEKIVIGNDDKTSLLITLECPMAKAI